MWVLFLVVFYKGVAMTPMPGYYATKEKCEEAAMSFTGISTTIFEAKTAYCILAPDDIGYE